MGQHVRAGDLEMWTEQVGQGPDVLLIGGLGDTVESWQFQLPPDRLRQPRRRPDGHAWGVRSRRG
jgi:hypothetical protein